MLFRGRLSTSDVRVGLTAECVLCTHRSILHLLLCKCECLACLAPQPTSGMHDGKVQLALGCRVGASGWPLQAVGRTLQIKESLQCACACADVHRHGRRV